MVTLPNLALFYQKEGYGNLELSSNEKPVGVNDVWNTFLLNGVDQVCGWTRGGRFGDVETLQCNDYAGQYIKEKGR